MRVISGTQNNSIDDSITNNSQSRVSGSGGIIYPQSGVLSSVPVSPFFVNESTWTLPQDLTEEVKHSPLVTIFDQEAIAVPILQPTIQLSIAQSSEAEQQLVLLPLLESCLMHILSAKPTAGQPVVIPQCEMKSSNAASAPQNSAKPGSVLRSLDQQSNQSISNYS